MENNSNQKQDCPLVFVRCLTFNHEAYIEDALNGFVMQQTNFPFVVTIVNDASPDNTKNVIEKFITNICEASNIIHEQTSYADIIKATPKENPNCLLFILNLYENHFLKKSHRPYYQEYVDKAKYWAECEGDDYWTDPLKLQKQVDFMEANPEVGLCYTDYNRLEDCTGMLVESLFEKQKSYRTTSYEAFLLKPGYLAPMTWLYRSHLKHFVTTATAYSDGTYAYMLEFLHNSKVAYIPEATATYRSHIGSASSPIGSLALFRYSIGVFRTQIHYTQKYPCSEELKNKVLMRGYLAKLPIAIMANNEEFIQEARDFMESQDLDIDLIIRELKQGEMKKNSRAYKLGKKILAPLTWLKNKINHGK